MPQKAKKPKEKKGKKDKGKQKDNESHDRTMAVTKRIAVCGDEATVQEVVSQAGRLKTATGGAEVTINVENGMSGPEDVAPGGDYDGILCAYDIRDQKSYTFLEEKNAMADGILSLFIRKDTNFIRQNTGK
ncbi:unnamed protein product [Dibothriocephalus latus]|uniref:Uncharacterized protein n=1 Tax=Dibothriocephalus latus TaxID=60516 RepID=A0A3P7NM68_DIBLA|nr:unnamed protein product [Dibothriocephalus latus]